MARVRVVEVGPRDGLQNEAVIVGTADKVRLVERLAGAGLAEIEVSSFVRPDRLPQLADASEVFAALAPRAGVRYSALVPNRKGLERAGGAGVRAVALFTGASETFTRRNIGMGIAESLDTFRDLMPDAGASGLWVRAYVSTAFHCPYEGRIAPAQVVPIVAQLLDMGVDEVALADTIGRAAPEDARRLAEAVAPVLPTARAAYHFHDTGARALANVETALSEFGVTCFDAAVGGAGGCPYAPGAPGNLATESLVAWLHAHGHETGIDAAKLAAAAKFLREIFNRKDAEDAKARKGEEDFRQDEQDAGQRRA